jgi:hypothetical protein
LRDVDKILLEICKYFHPICSSFAISRFFFCKRHEKAFMPWKEVEENVCLFFTRANFRQFLAISWKNRKTVCFLLFCQLLFTHFRYSINLIGMSFIVVENIYRKMISQFCMLFDWVSCSNVWKKNENWGFNDAFQKKINLFCIFLKVKPHWKNCESIIDKMVKCVLFLLKEDKCWWFRFISYYYSW